MNILDKHTYHENKDCYSSKDKFVPYNTHQFAGKMMSLAYSHHLYWGGAEAYWIIQQPKFSSEPSEIEKEFIAYANKWKDETGLFSTTFHKVVHDAYLDIIGMGRDVIPFILEDIQNGGPAHWHNALKAITKDNPVPDEDLGKTKKIKEAWINWGKKKGII